MGTLRQVGEWLMEGARAQARWEREVSFNIIHNRNRLIWLLLACLPLIVIPLAQAADVDILGGKTAYAPAFYSDNAFFVSIFIGLIAGLITGCIGAGGGFIITPALMAAGIKGILAVGTDLFHIFAKAIMGTVVHKKLGNVSVPLAIAFLAGAIIGSTVGGSINLSIFRADPLLSELFISTIYAVLLGFLGFYALFDYLKSIKKHVAIGSGAASVKSARLPAAMQSLNIPPMIPFDLTLPSGPRRISAFVIAGGGFIVGMLAAIMGVGGGFVTFPMFVYVFGVSAMTTVGTDILQIIFTAGYASISGYVINGYVFYTLALGMLLGSLLGIQIGALVTKVVEDAHIRGFYALSILTGFINRASTLPKKLTELEYVALPANLVDSIEFVGNITFWCVVAIFGIWVVGKFIKNFSKLRSGA
ncbi:MAG: sulfite exporter TauE/SafE family protein [Desulfovibrio sp.]|nr:sulfite exporter TauE/SafE family protein [Desulfovibrio sp.]